MPKYSSFYYDVMIDKTDYCNRVSDIEYLKRMVDLGRKVVLYAPRRYGKSSLVRNIVGEDFQLIKNNITLYINFMEVQNIEHIAERMLQSLREILNQKYPFKSKFTHLLESFKGMSVSLGIDPSTQLPSFELKPSFDNDKKNLPQIFSVIKNLSLKYNLFIIFDEFQDISLIPQAAGLLRTELQTLKTISVVILGSKKQLLNSMFASNKSPFFNFGDEHALSTIEPKLWQTYFNERLLPHTISKEAMQYLCETVYHVPNSICEIGFYLKEFFSNRVKTCIEISDVAIAIEKIIQLKESTFRFQEGQLNSKEQALLRYIAKYGYLVKYTEQVVVHTTKISSGSIVKIITRLTNKGWIEFEEAKGYRISDPLFSCFLKSKY